MSNPRFVTFEGGEGAGKSTQVRRLVEKLGASGIAAVETREPGGSPFAERVRSLILDPATPPHGAFAETLLFTAARADHLEHTIRPALEQGKWVVCDRFIDSTRAYQGAGGGLPLDTLRTLETLVLGDSRPDLTIILDIPADVGLARAGQRLAAESSSSGESGPPPQDPYEARDLSFHERLRDAFLEIAKAEPARCMVVDGTLGAEDISSRIWAEVVGRLGAGRA